MASLQGREGGKRAGDLETSSVVVRHADLLQRSRTNDTKRKNSALERRTEAAAEEEGNSKVEHRRLSSEDIQRMRELRTADPQFWTQRALARKFGVSTLVVAMFAKAPKEMKERHKEMRTRKLSKEERTEMRERAARERLEEMQVWYNRHRLLEMIERQEDKEATPGQLAYEQSLLDELRSHVSVHPREPRYLVRAKEEKEKKERALKRMLDADTDKAQRDRAM